MGRNFIIYAPNVNKGGGLILLDEILRCSKDIQVSGFFDGRAKDLTKNIKWFKSYSLVQPNVLSRLAAEFSLWRLANKDKTVICFHGLPPLLPSRAKVFVLLQNSLYIDDTKLNIFPIRIGLRIFFERLIGSLFRNRVDGYIVQTPSMHRKLKSWLSKNPLSPKDISIAISSFGAPIQKNSAIDHEKIWDFIYIADGSAHKNHERLFEAWRELAELGVRPTLAITLGLNDQSLLKKIDNIRNQFVVNIVNIGYMKHDEVIVAYQKSKALIFPSISESLGLPLLEAKALDIPILASELDYVRDVCNPSQTFNPLSHTSIKLAVMRHLGIDIKNTELCSGDSFWKIINGE